MDEETKIEETSSENVVVDKGKLDAVLGELQELRQKTTMLESIADKKELAKFLDKSKDRTKRVCRLRTLRDDEGNSQVVISWGRMISNEVYQNPQGQTVAKQVVKVKTEDGKEISGDLLNIGRSYEYIDATKVGEAKDEEGNIVWEVKASNGKTYSMDIRFIN